MRQHQPKNGIHEAKALKQVGHCNECGLPVYKIGDTIRHIIAEPPPCTQREIEREAQRATKREAETARKDKP